MKKSLLLPVLFFSFFTSFSQSDMGFENLPLGVNSSTAWISSLQPTSPLSSPICNGPSTVTLLDTTSMIVSTPIEDLNCKNITASPFSGNKVILLNHLPIGSLKMTTLRQNFQVTAGSSIYRYAYKAVLDPGTQTYCDAGFLAFNFYDCSNNLLSALGTTITTAYQNHLNPDSAAWAKNTANYTSYTKDWVLHSVNLTSYIGSCITVEVIVSPCSCGAHPGYCYYDSECSDNFLETDKNTLRGTNNSYTTCAATSTLAGTQGFSSYLWQGPAGSGISGSTTSMVSASVSGTYSLTAATGSQSAVNVFNLSLAGTPSLVLTASSLSTCVGGTVNLQAQASPVNGYTWSTGSNVSNIAITPTVTSPYTIFVANSAGCMADSSVNITVSANPHLVHISLPSLTVCAGVPFNLTAMGNSNNSYTWSTGANTPTISASITVATIYTVAAHNILGCVSSDVQFIQVYSPTFAQITATTNAVCPGQSTGLSIQNPAVASYTWSTGQTNQPITVAPTMPSVYSLTITDSYGCNYSSTDTIAMLPVPQVQIVPSSSAICVGQSVTLTANTDPLNALIWNTGVQTYTIFDTPSLGNGTYRADVQNQFGCTSFAAVIIPVFPLPQVQILSSKDNVCKGESLTLSVDDPNMAAYNWYNGATGPSVTLIANTAMAYSVVVTDNHGCSSSANMFVDVAICTGIQNYAAAGKELLIFPNPTNGAFTIQGYEAGKGVIMNALGQQLSEINLSAGNNFSQSFHSFAPGIYFIKMTRSTARVVVE